MDIEEAQNIDLIRELEKRFCNGVVYLEHMMDKDRQLRLIQSWGNSTWGIGAGQVLSELSIARHGEECETISGDEDDS